MMQKKHTLFILVLSVLISLLLPVSTLAQNYSFAVPELRMQVFILPDAAAKIVYDITFDNYGSPIDIVDIGTPTDDYDISNMRASVDGTPVTKIRKSEYIDTGVEIHLQGAAIPSGQKGTLRFEFTMPDMVFSDTTNEENASFQITPTWFDNDLVSGSGNIEIRVMMLEGIQIDEVLYQDVAFSDKVMENGRVMAIWRYDDVRATQAYRVGVSFPRQGLTRVVEITFWDLALEWLSGALAAILGVVAMCFPVAIPGFVIWQIIRAVIKGSKPDYLPPIAQVEGGGIKRGLTAPEAGVVLELKLTKVMTLVMFGMLEKGLIRQTKDDPLTVEVVEDFRAMDDPNLKDAKAKERQKFRRTVAQQKGTIIHKYENSFLDVFEKNLDKPVNKLSVVRPMQVLVNGAAAKMKGFDLSDTQDYYRRVIERAMEQASALGEIEQREEYLDKYLPWVMLDNQWASVMRVGTRHYWPRWARATRTASAPAHSGGRATSSGRSISPKFGDVAASFAGWAETTMGGMAAVIMPTRLQKPAPPSSSSSGGSSGSSCACACAGCACACACAGGGR